MTKIFSFNEEARRHLESSFPGARYLSIDMGVHDDLLSTEIEAAISSACRPHPDLLGAAGAVQDGPWGQGITVYVALP